jgi:dTDP-glucose pyrophosphorylase
VIAPGKSDILEYYGGDTIAGASFVFVVQPHPAGLCDALFRAAPVVSDDEPVLIGLPDTIWFPVDGLCSLGEDELSFLLFPVEHPEFFDAVVTDGNERVLEIQVKQRNALTFWVWGAFKMPGAVCHSLHALWLERQQSDEYFGTLVNAWIARGGSARGIRAGTAYVDVGTLHGYREAIRLLSDKKEAAFA